MDSVKLYIHVYLVAWDQLGLSVTFVAISLYWQLNILLSVCVAEFHCRKFSGRSLFIPFPSKLPLTSFTEQCIKHPKLRPGKYCIM